MAFHQSEPAHIVDDLGGRQGAWNHGLGIGRLGQQVLDVFDLPLQQPEIRGVLGRRQQRHGEQIHRIDHRHRIDGARQRGGRGIHGAAQPGRMWINALFPPRRVVRVKELGKFQRLAEIDMDLAKIALKQAHRAEQSGQRFGLLRPTVKFGQVAAALHQLLIADVHRNEHQWPRPAAHETLYRHGKNSGLGRQHAPAAATPAFDKVFDREAAIDHQVQILQKHRRVERLALELATQEEGSAASQHGADQRQIQVGPGSNMRHHQSPVEDDVGEQQIIHMASVAGHINDAVTWRHRGDTLEVVNFDPVEDLVPDPAQEQRQGLDYRIAVVRGDLERELPG